MSDTTPETHSRPVLNSSLPALSLSALGVVFGDIGTSPLYTFKTVLALNGAPRSPAVTLGALSLIIWTLVVVVTIKYISFAMRIDNDGEGGILALMSLLGVKVKPRYLIVLIGLMGAALIYGDGTITPAISVLSAVEGLNMTTYSFARYVLPISLLIIVGLFLFQSRGTARIGMAFGPIMLIWFVSMALLGIWGIVQHPAVFLAINPIYAIRYLFGAGMTGFLVLGGVFLCVTGAEALYADMGHLGARPIRLAWSALVFPSLILNYAGQAALVLSGAPATGNIFYRLCPTVLLMPLVVLATVATIIASQAIITGTFSITRQAIHLGWLPRLYIKQTSAEEYGQIYIRAVNWLLMIVTCGLIIGFRKSDNLAAAYGIAVSGTMLATSALLFMAMRQIWGWGIIRAGTIAGAFMVVDTTFFISNLTKFISGGYVPLLLAAFVFGAMLIWHRGARVVAARIQEAAVPVSTVIKDLSQGEIQRVPGTGVFLTVTEQDVPPVMGWYFKHSRALHEHLLVLRVVTESIPWVDHASRLTLNELAPHFWRAEARYGFMERPNIPALLKQANECGCDLNVSEVTYYAGYVTVLPRQDGKGLPKWFVSCFSFMQRNSVQASNYYRLPSESLVEIGRTVSI